MLDFDFYKGKRVFVTGHTGFKGSWLCLVLESLGAKVTGYSLAPPSEQNLFDLVNAKSAINHNMGDIRDFENLKKVFNESKPEVVLHLVAQPIVLESYQNPRLTYETNVMGTVNLLECIRTADFEIQSILNVTTDKVYQNNEWCWGYRENEPLDGFDHYSNSKSCSELVTHSYKNSFFGAAQSPSISTARAGNVIGGGDFAANRIIPDCVRAAIAKNDIIIRNPNSIRPYQHVLEPLFAYLMIAEKQVSNKELQGWYNVGPNESDCVTTGQLVDGFCKKWGQANWIDQSQKDAPHEASFLKLDCSKIKNNFNWKPKWDIKMALEKTVEWSKAYENGGDLRAMCVKQINEFIK